jgi:hypothetical protein
VRDPREGVGADGTIVTGVDRQAVPAAFEPVLHALAEELAAWPGVTSYVYGSVATGQAQIGRSDVDLLTIGLPAERAVQLGGALSDQFAGLCREVAIGPAQADDLIGDDDAAYGMRVFLRHYCAPLQTPAGREPGPAFPADARAARGFNGDIDRHLARWREAATDADPAALGRGVARKTLLATAGLVSVLDGTWTTDRALGADRFAVHRPELADGVRRLLAWATDEVAADGPELQATLAPSGIVESVVAEFRAVIGLWAGTR